jgi:ABC-type branched-subunit amino acid transport system ATPase component
MERISKTIKSSVLYRSSKVLSKSDKRKLFAVVLIQIMLGALDLVGVGLIGVIGSLAINGVGSKQPGNRVQWLLDQLNLGSYDLQMQATILGILAVSIMVLKTVLSMIFIRKILYFLSFKGARLSSILVARLLAQPLLTVQSRSNQETLFALTSGVGSITIGVLATFVALISDTSLLLVMAIGLFVVYPILSVSTFALFATIAFMLYRIMQVRARKLGERNRQTNVDSNSLILEVLTSYRELVVKNRRFYYSRKIGEQRHQLAAATAELSFMPNISKYVIEITVIVGSLMISAIQFVTQDAAHAVATLGVFFAASTRIAPAVLRVQQSSLSIRASSGLAEPTLELIESLGIDEIIKENDATIDFDHEGFIANIEIVNVSLKYPGKEINAVSNLSLSIDKGEIVAFVGPSGAGKTTIIDILLGILEPDKGRVEINGLSPLDAISTWPGAIGYMPQDILISNGTVRENVMLGFDSNPMHDQRVQSAITIAQLSEFVQALPKGLDQPMGDRGTSISGGQRQRLGIARAIFTAPKLLVLDEATSALDGETEANISSAIQAFRGDVTVLMIAHRLSTVLTADRVVYMDKGEIKAQGSFEEVRRAVPDFDRQANLMGL